MERRDKIDIALTIAYASISYASFAGSFFAIILHRNITDPLLIVTVLVGQKILKLLIDTPIAVFADIYGTRIIFLISPILSIICSLLLFYDSIISIVIMIAIHAVDTATKSGNIETRIYNTLKRNNEEKKFSKILCAFFITSNLTMGLIGYLSAVLYREGGYKFVVYATVISSAISFICVWFLRKKDVIIDQLNKTASAVVKNSISFTKKNQIVIFLALILAYYNFFSWQFSQIAKVTLLADGVAVESVLKFYSISRVSMGCGSIMAYFISELVSLRHSLYTWVAFLFFIIITSFSAYKYDVFGTSIGIIVLPMIIYPFIFSTIQVPVIRVLESIVISSVRATLSSFTGSIAVIINITGNLLIGYIAKKLGYHYSIGVVSSMFLICTMPLLWHISKTKEYNHRST